MRSVSLIAFVAFVAFVACGAEPPPSQSCGAAGRVVQCACAGGGSGAQECGPGGVWGVCACPDAGAVDVSVDASNDVVDVPVIDGQPVPRIYTGCTLGSSECGPGLECLAVAGSDGGTRGLCSVRCADPEGCPPGPFPAFVCMDRVCMVNCDRRTGPDPSVCATGLRCIFLPNSMGPSGSRCTP